jgi:hypothetical protein
MVRGSAVVLGIGLAILWLVGLQYHASSWLTWLNGVAALGSFGIALMPASTPPARLASSPIVMAMALFVLWIVALAVGAEAWLAWWTFAFGAAFMLVGIIAYSERRPTRVTTTTPRMI